MKRSKTYRDRRILIWFDERKLFELEPSEITEEDRVLYAMLTLHPEHGKYFPKGMPKTDHCSQEEFARLMGITQQRVSQLLLRRVLTPALPWRIWVVQFISYTKGAAAGRTGREGDFI